jgi:hypothetical protein
MPTWSEIQSEIFQTAVAGGPPQGDHIRRKYLDLLQKHTSRTTIIYATRFLQAGNTPPNLVSIGFEDVQGFMEVVHATKGPGLDLILHSPGGSIEAAEAIVDYLRAKFKHIRIIVPLYAQSAATVMACAANKIVMGKHSFLGPTDPQIFVKKEHDARYVPAQGILDQFDKAIEACENPKLLPAWLPMLKEYGPNLLAACETAKQLSMDLVEEWLAKYMLKTNPRKKEKAKSIAAWLADHSHHKSHGRPIPRAQLKRRGMEVDFLESDQKFQDLVLSVIHATTITFDMTPAAKIIENHLGKAFIKVSGPQLVFMPGIPGSPGGMPPGMPMPPGMTPIAIPFPQQRPMPTQPAPVPNQPKQA